MWGFWNIFKNNLAINLHPKNKFSTSASGLYSGTGSTGLLTTHVPAGNGEYSDLSLLDNLIHDIELYPFGNWGGINSDWIHTWSDDSPHDVSLVQWEGDVSLMFSSLQDEDAGAYNYFFRKEKVVHFKSGMKLDSNFIYINSYNDTDHAFDFVVGFSDFYPQTSEEYVKVSVGQLSQGSVPEAEQLILEDEDALDRMYTVHIEVVAGGRTRGMTRTIIFKSYPMLGDPWHSQIGIQHDGTTTSTGALDANGLSVLIDSGGRGKTINMGEYFDTEFDMPSDPMCPFFGYEINNDKLSPTSRPTIRVSAGYVITSDD